MSETNSPYKEGEVREVDADRRRARVEFPDEDGVVSFWLKVPGSGTRGAKRATMPRVGELVGCLVDWRGESGMIVGSLYNDQDKSPTTALENDHTTHEDGAVVEHDPVTHVHRLQLPHAGSKLFLEAGGTRLLITKDGIIASKPVLVGNVPDIPVRGKRQ